MLPGTGVTHSTPPLAMGTVSPGAGTKQSLEKGFWEHSRASASAFILSFKLEHRRNFSFDLTLGYLQVMLSGGFTCAITKFRLSMWKQFS